MVPPLLPTLTVACLPDFCCSSAAVFCATSSCFSLSLSVNFFHIRHSRPSACKQFLSLSSMFTLLTTSLPGSFHLLRTRHRCSGMWLGPLACVQSRSVHLPSSVSSFLFSIHPASSLLFLFPLSSSPPSSLPSSPHFSNLAQWKDHDLGRELAIVGFPFCDPEETASTSNTRLTTHSEWASKKYCS